MATFYFYTTKFAFQTKTTTIGDENQMLRKLGITFKLVTTKAIFNYIYYHFNIRFS